MIITLSVLAFLLGGFLIYALSNQNWHVSMFDFQTEKVYDQVFEKETIDQLEVSTSSTDVWIKHSDTSQIRVVIYDKKGTKSEVENKEETLRILMDRRNNFCLGFCFRNSKVEIYLPKEYEGKLTVTGTSADVEVETFPNIDAKIRLSSGNLEAEQFRNLEGKTSSGNISVERMITGDLQASSGNIQVQEVDWIKAAANSGNIRITSVYKKMDVSTTSGNITCQEVKLEENSSLSASSGNIKIGYLAEDIYVQADSRSGSIKIKEQDRFAKMELKINTSSGNITVR